MIFGAAHSVGSLFSGIGGMDLGLELAGFRTAWQVEIDPWRRAVLAKHWPDIPRYDDVSTLAVSAADLPPVDVICGGFPCQDASVANPGGRGIEGARTGLWFHMLDLIRALRPVGVIGENVPGLLRRGLDVACRGLQDAGYEVEAARVRASDFGLAHRRERVVIVAVLADAHAGRSRPGSGSRSESAGWAAPDGRGEGVANSICGRSSPRFGSGDLAGAERKAPEVGDSARGGGAPGMANADRDGQPQPPRGLAEQRGWTGDSGTGAPLVGHGYGQGQPQRQGVGGDARAQQPAAVGAGGRPAQPRLGGVAHGLPAWVDSRCAGRGEAQYAEEPPRTAHRQRGDGSPQRVSALGNAFVPLCAYVAGMRLLERLSEAA